MGSQPMQVAGFGWMKAISVLVLALLTPIPDVVTVQASQTLIPGGQDGMTIAVNRMVSGLLSYIRWPSNPSGANRRLCIIGQPRLVNRITPQAGWTSGTSTTGELLAGAPCDALYLGVIPDHERLAVMGWLRGRSVATLTDADPECRYGAMFCLTRAEAGLRYTVNLDAVARSRLMVDPRVLQMGHNAGDAT